MTGALAAAYHSGAQRARVVTESWGESNLYCPNCSSPKLTWLEPGHPASDYSCPKCRFWFQLKSQKSRIGDSITDGAYDAMMDAIKRDETPSFYFMQYELATWRVKNLLLVPSFAFPPSAIIKRKPLSSAARRAGWVGCNFALNRIPADARIVVVTESQVTPAAEVRKQFRHIKPLKDIPIQMRGWTLDVLNIVRRLVEDRRSLSCIRWGEATDEPAREDARPTNTFTTAEVYAFERELEKLHPDNRHVRDKIRQQLQVLRDAGLLLHVGRGEWRLPL
jgi:type II restriction enzyme